MSKQWNRGIAIGKLPIEEFMLYSLQVKDSLLYIPCKVFSMAIFFCKTCDLGERGIERLKERQRFREKNRCHFD